MFIVHCSHGATLIFDDLLYIGETKLLFRMKSAIVVWMRSWSASKAHLHKASCSLILLSW